MPIILCWIVWFICIIRTSTKFCSMVSPTVFQLHFSSSPSLWHLFGGRRQYGFPTPWLMERGDKPFRGDNLRRQFWGIFESHFSVIMLNNYFISILFLWMSLNACYMGTCIDWLITCDPPNEILLSLAMSNQISTELLDSQCFVEPFYYQLADCKFFTDVNCTTFLIWRISCCK